jgi:peptide/nickel transport system substrate-binding protein
MHRSHAPAAVHRLLAVLATLILVVGCTAPAPTAQSTPDAKPAAPAATSAPAAATTAPAAAKPTEPAKPAAAGATTEAKPAAGTTSAAAPVGAAAKPATAGPGDGPTLVMALDQSDVKTLDPGREFEFGAAFVCLNTYDTLVNPKSPTELSTFVPNLAKSWTVSPDGKEYTFVLRDDVKFASGNPLTADDVKFSLMRLKNLKGNPGWMADPLKEVQVVDTTTVKTVLTDAFADWLNVLAGPNLAIMDSKLLKEHGGSDADNAEQADTSEEWLNQNSAGSGPFILKGWDKNDTIRFERNPNYFLGAAKIAKVEVRDVPSPATQKLLVENGDIDIAVNLTPDLVETMRNNPNVKIITGQSLDNLYLGMTANPDLSPELAKKEVRQAIRYAIDYDGVLALTNNRAVRGPAVYSIGVLGLTQADADRLNPKLDLDKAKKLLADAGLANGFKFEMEYGTGPSPVGITYESIAQKVQADLKKVNIDVQLVPKEFGVMLTNYRAKKSIAVISYNQPDYLGASDWASQMILNTWAPRLYYDSPQAKDLATRANAELDPQKRIELYQQMLQLLVDEGPYVMLVQGKIEIVTRPNIQGYEYFPLGAARLLPVSKQ